MNGRHFFGSAFFGPVLGRPARRSGLGACIEPDPGGSGGCRDVVACPKGPSVSNNPDGAAGPGQGRRYAIVDYQTGALIKADVGDEVWGQYSVTSLPDAWVCDDPRCKPYCGTKPAETPTSGCTPTGTQIKGEGEYTPLPCPTGPDCYDIIDAQTGAVAIKGIQGLIGGSQVNHRSTGACLTHGYTYGQQDQPAPAITPTPPPPPPPPPPLPPPPPPPLPAPGPDVIVIQPATCVRVLTLRDPRTIISVALEPYQTRGYHIYRVPTGEVIGPGTRSEFEVVDLWACPPGMTPPGAVITDVKKPPVEPAPEKPAETPEADDTTGLAVAGGVLAAVAAAFALS